MTTSNEHIDTENRREKLSAILKSLQTWWLVLVASSLCLAILLAYLNHRRSPDALQLTLISAAAVFLMGILLSAINTERKAHKGDDPFIWLARIRCVIAIGVAVLVGFAAAQTGANPGVVAALGVLTAGAAWITGLLLGFIFGLPQPSARTSTSDQRTYGQTESDQASAEAPTNLEHIADWLTKLIVGAGLTQLTKLPGQLDSLANYIGKGMGDVKAYKLFALAICIFFSLCGFLYGYLWGRLFMPGAFRFDPFRLNERDASQADRQRATIAAR